MNEFQESSAEIKARAVKYAAEGNYHRAIAEYKKILDIQPEDPDVLNLVGDIYRRLGNKEKAIEMFEKAVQVYSRQAYYDNAIAICKKILRVEPNRSEVIKTLAELYGEQGLTGQATALLVDYARKKKEEGEHEAMLDAYKKLVEIRPKDIGLRMKLADEYIGMGRMGDACTQLQEISVLYREEGKYEEVSNIEKLIREITTPGAEEKEGENYWELANKAEVSGEIDDAVKCYYKAAEQFLAQATYHLAKDAFLKIADLKPKELKPWQKLVEMANTLNDKNGAIEAYIGLAKALMERNAVDSATSVYKKILLLDPDNEEAKKALTALGKEEPTVVEAPAAAEEPPDKPIFKVAEETFPEQPIALDELIDEFRRGVEKHIEKDDYATYYDLGVSFKEMGRLDEAISHLMKAAEGDKEKLKAYELLGRCYIEKGDFETAIFYLKKGLSLDGFNQNEYLGLRYNLAIAYEATGQLEEALKEYKIIESKDSQYFDVPERIKRLESKVSITDRKEKDVLDQRGGKISYI